MSACVDNNVYMPMVGQMVPTKVLKWKLRICRFFVGIQFFFLSSILNLFIQPKLSVSLLIGRLLMSMLGVNVVDVSLCCQCMACSSFLFIFIIF